jgi:transcriptional regulator with XRE-family HTH domain
MTKHELAQKSGVSISFLSDLTNGKANPSLKVMAAIAKSLETPLPTLLELTDLDQGTLDAIADGQVARSLPVGFVRVSVILTEFQAYKARLWHQENLARLKL